jgi:hypothetical protein
MRGVADYEIACSPDYYLDHRRPDWSEAEFRRFIRYCPDDDLVYVRVDRVPKIVEALTWLRRCVYGTEVRR